MTPTDEQLREAYCRTGDQQPASELVRRYLPRVRRIIFPMVLDHSTADDLSQEVMIRAIGGLSGFNGQASLSTWVTRIALNATYTFLQKQKRQSAAPLPDVAVDKSFDRSPVHVAIGNELNTRIRSSLDELTPKLRAAIVLTAMNGVSPSEAAEIEECTVSTMHWRIHEARKQLRTQLKEYVTDEGDEQ
ncbi:MAG: RNA polymerase sigma factor [Pirellulaceae bacterium]|nr:RNA polymerase sigma factor [Pirellulaceae bacterium]